MGDMDKTEITPLFNDISNYLTEYLNEMADFLNSLASLLHYIPEKERALSAPPPSPRFIRNVIERLDRIQALVENPTAGIDDNEH